jgi:hypothetical protein
LPVGLYGWETWSHTLKEKHWLRVFENRALRRIFRLKEEEVTGKWSRLHSQEMGGACSTYIGEERCMQGFSGFS